MQKLEVQLPENLIHIDTEVEAGKGAIKVDDSMKEQLEFIYKLTADIKKITAKIISS